MTKTIVGKRTPIAQPPVVSSTNTLTSSSAQLGCKEDDADPPLSPFKSEGATTATVKDPIDKRLMSARQLITAAKIAATPPSVARRHNIDNVGKTIVIAFTLDAMTICEWSPRERHFPATVATVALSLSSMARVTL